MATQSNKPLAAAVGAAFLASVALAPMASASENPFQANGLTGGYNLAEKAAGEGKCGEGKCGDSMKKAQEGKDAEGKCGEGKCGDEMKKAHEGKCGAGKADTEGKCGAGKAAGSSAP